MPLRNITNICAFIDRFNCLQKKIKKSLLLNEVQRKSIPTAINRHLSISAIAQSILSTTNCSKCLNRFHLETTKMLLLCCVLNIITRMKSDTILGAFRHHKSACLCIQRTHVPHHNSQDGNSRHLVFHELTRRCACKCIPCHDDSHLNFFPSNYEKREKLSKLPLWLVLLSRSNFPLHLSQGKS